MARRSCSPNIIASSMVLTLSERSKGSCFSYAPTSRPFRQLRKRAAFNGALLQSACARVHRRRMACCHLQARRWPMLSGHASGCGKRDSHCTKRITKHSWRQAGTALLDLAASIRPKSVRARVCARTPEPFLLCRGRFPKRSETSSGHVHRPLQLHAMRTVVHHRHARHMRGTSSRMARTAPVRAPSRHARGACTAAQAQGCGTGGGSTLRAANGPCTGVCKGRWAGERATRAGQEAEA